MTAQQHDDSNCASASKYNPVEIIILGWRILLSELQWAGFKLLRYLEIRQLRKRLNQEYEILGQRTTDETAKTDPEIELCKKQIAFLKEEIEYLEQELVNARQSFIQRRERKLHLES